MNTAGPDAVSGSSSATMLQAANTGTGAGLRGSSSGDHGTIGFTEANDKAGVFGNTTGGYGVWGHSVDNHAVFGQSTVGRGVKGVSPAGGVFGESTQGLGVEGRSNTNDGVVGSTNHPERSGVFGNSPVGAGVTGRSAGRDGVLGVTTSSDAGHAGVHARNEGSGPAVYSEGDLYVTGAVYGNIGPAQGAPFPRPAFDSGWVQVDGGAEFDLGVDLYLPTSSYDNDNFVIDMQTRVLKASNHGVGMADGVYYLINNDNSIHVSVDENAWASEIRLRVWYYR